MQQDEGQPVDGAGGGPHPGHGGAAEGEDRHAEDDGECRDGAADGGEQAVGVLGDAQPAGEGLGDEDAHDVAGDGREGAAVVEERSAPFQ